LCLDNASAESDARFGKAVRPEHGALRAARPLLREGTRVSHRILVSYELCLELATVDQDGVTVVLPVHQENGRCFGCMENAAIEDVDVSEIEADDRRQRIESVSTIAFSESFLLPAAYRANVLCVPCVCDGVGGIESEAFLNSSSPPTKSHSCLDLV
jgi:hypothetical protein